MTRLTVVIGAVLVVLGVVVYVATAAASVTALIPSLVGVLLLLCALLARKPGWHRHGIHAALVVALLGALGTLMNVVRIGEVFAEEIAGPFRLRWQLHFSRMVPRMAVFVSKFSHCLHDVLSRYDSGEWKERKVTPDKWEFTYAVPKRRAGNAPEGSGVPVGTEYHWYILAHQTVRKLHANDYTTAMTGMKYKLAHKRAGAEKWSATDKAQRRQLIRILEEMIADLKEGLDAQEPQPAPAEESGDGVVHLDTHRQPQRRTAA
jgi:hypothetical protein